ncbi:neural cell adhesion molecule 2-like [Mytilus trossulus]|uniref:neural cell adhesion molecule 2-like n=1 Tax=Mytilus trossulus TaxID=6551 RepID=UPI003006B073
MKGEQLKLLSSNNLIVSNDHQHKLKTIGNHRDGEYNLVIQNFSANDQDLYRCQGIVKETAFAADIMTVLAMSPNISIAVKPSADILEGNRISLECIDSSNVPSKNYSWKRDGSLLTDATSYVLEINNVTKKDSGIYTCRVQNMIGSSGSSVRLNVYRKNNSSINSITVYKFDIFRNDV